MPANHESRIQSYLKTEDVQESPPNIEIEEEEEGGVDDCSRVVGEGWYIPRPALCRNHTTCSTATERSIQVVAEWLAPSSNTSTQSGSSGSLLLTAANLAALRLEKTQEECGASVASSTHFTMVNTKVCKTRQSCCAKHHLTTLVVTTCSIFLLGLIAAVYYIDLKWKSVRYS